MTTPSHLAIARLEHAIVRTERELYTAHELGHPITEEELRQRLDMMNRVYHYYHHSPSGEEDASGHLGLRQTSKDSYAHHLPTFKEWLHEPTGEIK